MRYTKIIVIAILLGIITYFLFDIQLNNYNQNLEKDLIIINCFYSINNDSYLEDLSFYHDYYQEEDSFNRNIFNSSAIIYKSFSVNLGKTETSFVIKFHTWKKVKDKWLYLYMINTHSYYMYNIDKIKSIKINDDIDGQKQTYTKDDLSTDKYNYYGNFRLEHEMFNKENGIYTIEILMEPIPIETNEIIIQNCIRDMDYYFEWNADEFVYVDSSVERENDNTIHYPPTNVSPINTRIETTIIRDKTKKDWNLYLQFGANALAFSVVIASLLKYLLEIKV